MVSFSARVYEDSYPIPCYQGFRLYSGRFGHEIDYHSGLRLEFLLFVFVFVWNSCFECWGPSAGYIVASAPMLKPTTPRYMLPSCYLAWNSLTE